jgi:hypothetical protein
MTWTYQANVISNIGNPFPQTYVVGWINASNESGGTGVTNWVSPTFLSEFQSFTVPADSDIPQPTPYNATPYNQTITTTLLSDQFTPGDVIVLVTQGLYQSSRMFNIAQRVTQIVITIDPLPGTRFGGGGGAGGNETTQSVAQDGCNGSSGGLRVVCTSL